jgi:beta-lactamase class D
MFNRRQFGKTFFMTAAATAFGSVATAAADPLPDPQLCTVIEDMAIEDTSSGASIYRQGQGDMRFSPCSTFKIAIALMGFDSGILQDTHHPLWDYQPAYAATRESDKKPVDPTIWLAESVVWYSQQTTRKLGMDRFKAYVDKFNYGNRDVSGNPGKHDGLTHAWLTSSLRISTNEQVGFIRRFLARDLGLSARAYEMTVASLPVFQAPGGWAVHGKTGTGTLRDEHGKVRRDRPLGWFVGWAEKGGRRLVFARSEIGSEAWDTPGGPRVRSALLADLEKMVGDHA